MTNDILAVERRGVTPEPPCLSFYGDTTERVKEFRNRREVEHLSQKYAGRGRAKFLESIARPLLKERDCRPGIQDGCPGCDASHVFVGESRRVSEGRHTLANSEDFVSDCQVVEEGRLHRKMYVEPTPRGPRFEGYKHSSQQSTYQGESDNQRSHYSYEDCGRKSVRFSPKLGRGRNFRSNKDDISGSSNEGLRWVKSGRGRLLDVSSDEQSDSDYELAAQRRHRNNDIDHRSTRRCNHSADYSDNDADDEKNSRWVRRRSPSFVETGFSHSGDEQSVSKRINEVNNVRGRRCLSSKTEGNVRESRGAVDLEMVKGKREETNRYSRRGECNLEDRMNQSDINHKRLTGAMKPAKFDGLTSIDTFLIQFETCAQYNGWSDGEKTAHLKCCLAGQAGQILWENGDPSMLTYDELVMKLRARYGTAGQRELFLAQLQARRRKPNESLAELYRDIKRLMVLSYPQSSGSELSEEIAKSHFISALGNRDLELKIREREPKDLDSAFTIAVRLEAYQSACREDDGREQKPVRGRNADGLAGRVATIEQKLKDGHELDKQREQLRRELEYERSERDRLSREIGRLKLLEEQRCVREAAIVTNPLNRAQSDVARAPGTTSANRKTEMHSRSNQVTCYRCKGRGHYARDCHVKTAGSATESPTVSSSSDQVSQVMGTESKAFGRESYIQLTLFGQTADCLLDTGSDVTLVPSRLVGSLPMEPSSQKLMAANGTAIKVLGIIDVTAKTGGHLFNFTGFVSDQVTEVILGLDFLRAHKALWCFSRAEIILDGHSHQLRRRGKVAWARRVVATESVVVPGKSECVVPSHILFNGFPAGASEMNGEWITEQVKKLPGLYVSRVMLPDRSVDVPVRVLNIQKTEVMVPAGTVLADLELVTSVSEPVNVQGASIDAYTGIIDDLIERTDEAVPVETKRQLRTMLRNYCSILSTGERDLGRTSIAQHGIDTGDARPIRQPLRRHPPAHSVAIRDHVSTMLEQGIIEPTQSPWASNIVLVKKKDGSLRCCVDYRQLNNVTRKDAYPLPRIDVCLDSMSEAQWFSTFDFRSSYHQVEVRPEDADKTAFICREGLYRFNTMPFGLTGAPATFQRLMDMVMSGLAYEICLVYLDDVIVYSTSLEEHLRRLGLVLDRIKSSGLKIKPSKTHLLKRSVDFLGHVISYRGIQPQADKISAVDNWKRPENVHDVKAFVGLCTYYRRFVDKFADIAAPLYDLLKKGAAFVWSQACEQAFEHLKTALTTAPILGMPNEVDQFVFDTDASNHAVGAVLSQLQNGREVVIAYASRRLSPAERNYCITRRELLAIVVFVKQFRHYILGRRFLIRTDHAALQWLRKVSEPIGQQARWLELLEEYDYDIIRRAGNRHGNADVMSRRPCDRPRCCRL